MDAVRFEKAVRSPTNLRGRSQEYDEIVQSSYDSCQPYTAVLCDMTEAVLVRNRIRATANYLNLGVYTHLAENDDGTVTLTYLAKERALRKGLGR